MWHELEIDFGPDKRCRFYLDWEYFDGEPLDYEALTEEERKQRRERDKEQFLSEFSANYNWGPHSWSYPEHEARALIDVLRQCDMLEGRKRPQNNGELEALLKEAVSEERLIVEIVPDGDGGIYAPPGNPAPTTPDNDGILAPVKSFEPYQGVALRSGEPILSGPYDPATQEAKLNAARGLLSSAPGTSDDGGSGLLGIAEAAAGALLDDDANSGDDASDDSSADDGLTNGRGRRCDAAWQRAALRLSARYAEWRRGRAHGHHEQSALRRQDAWVRSKHLQRHAARIQASQRTRASR